MGDGPGAAAVPEELFENCRTAVCCFGVGWVRLTGQGGKEGARGCVISRQTGVSGWAVAGFSVGKLFSFLSAIPHMYSLHVWAKTRPAK